MDAGVERTIVTIGLGVVRHWLLIVTMALIVFVSLPLMAPFLMASGRQEMAQVIYNVYRVTCHQEPARSFFVAGPRLTYTWSEIETMTDLRPTSAYLGSPQIGYKMAYCERDTATYLAMLLGGLVIGLLGRRAPRLPLRLYVLFVLPMAVDGLTQLSGLRESTWLLRVLTGGLFGLGTAWLLYPALDDIMRQMAKDLSTRLTQV